MKATTEDFLKLNTLRGTKTAFLTPKSYDEHPVTFIWEYGGKELLPIFLFPLIFRLALRARFQAPHIRIHSPVRILSSL